MSLLLLVSSAIWSFPKEKLVMVVALWPHESVPLLSLGFWHPCQDQVTAAQIVSPNLCICSWAEGNPERGKLRKLLSSLFGV